MPGAPLPFDTHATTFIARRRPGDDRKARIRQFIHQPAFETWLVLLIVVSCVLTLIEVDAPLPDRARFWIFFVNDVLNGLFLGELAVRGWTYRNRRRFFGRYWLDILASLPLPHSSGLRIIRLLRLARLLRVGSLIRRRYLHGSGGEFAVIFTIAGIVIIVAASVMAVFEKDLAPEFGSFTYAFWWSVLSMVSNQPADSVPQSLAGRVIALVVVLTGLCLFAIVTGTAAAVMSQRLRRLEANPMDLEELDGHIVICGWDRRAPLVMEELQHSSEERHRAIVVVADLEELPPMNWKIVDRERVYLVTGDFTKAENLEKAGIRRAAKAIIMSDKTGNRTDQDRDARTILAALTIEKLNRDIYTCAELLNREHEPHLRMAGVEDVVCVSEYGATMMSSMAIHSGISSIIAELLSVQYGNEFFKLDTPPGLAGKTFGEAVAAFTKKDALLIAVERGLAGGKRGEMTLNPPASFVLQTGDRLVVISRTRPDIGNL